jgi:hypothetical protein
MRFVVSGNQNDWNADTGENVDAAREVAPDARKIACSDNYISVPRQIDDPGRRRFVPMKIAEQKQFHGFSLSKIGRGSDLQCLQLCNAANVQRSKSAGEPVTQADGTGDSQGRFHLFHFPRLG